MLDIKKDYEDLHYRDIMSIKLEKNVFSSKIILQSRFQVEIQITALGKKDECGFPEGGLTPNSSCGSPPCGGAVANANGS
jgi:hypothetical protein